MNRVLEKDLVTSGGGPAIVILPAKVNFAWEEHLISATLDLQSDIEIYDGSNLIWSKTYAAGSYEIAHFGKIFGTKGNSFTVKIVNSTAVCALYVSAEFH